MHPDHDIAFRLSSSRREFLRSAAGLTLGSALLRSPLARAARISTKKKVVVVTFGGGARDQETFAPEGEENIPGMMREMLPRASFFTQVVNRGILGHYVATASLATGVYETINNFAALPPANPTVFEYYRKDLKRPSSDAWVVAPSNGFNRIGESNHRSYGEGMGARVILPKYLLKAAMSGGGADYDHLLRDNYENPYYTPELGNREFELQQLEMILKLSADDFRSHAKTLSSPDELSLYIVRQLKLLTEGSGTQIFSTTFAQWIAREALRRAQPLTLLVRFAPRQRQKAMNELLSANSNQPEMDVMGSLIDAEMGAYYNWLDQQRLSGAEKSCFLVWFENHQSALAIGPSIPRQTESGSEADLARLLEWLV